MIILSIDPGYEKLGYAFFEKKVNGHITFHYLTSGLIKTSKHDAHEVRLHKAYTQLNLMCMEKKPDLIVIEELFFSKNVKTAIAVAQSQGVILLMAGQMNIPVKFMTPPQIKATITGYGNADKKSVQKMLTLLLKEDTPKWEDDDQSDAIACGLAYCYTNDKLVPESRI